MRRSHKACIQNIPTGREMLQAGLGVDTEVFSTKDSFDKSIRLEPRPGHPGQAENHQQFANSLVEHVDFANAVSYYAAQLVYLYILRGVQPDDGGGFPLPPLDSNLYYKALNCVCYQGQGPLELQRTWIHMQQMLPADWVPPDHDGKAQLRAQLGKEMAANLENHYALNFEAVLNRLVLFELPLGWSQKDRKKVYNYYLNSK